jgi:hypothetical protein
MAFAAGSTYKIENILSFGIRDTSLAGESYADDGEVIKDGLSITETVGKSVISAFGNTRKTSEKGVIAFELFYQDVAESIGAYEFLKTNNGLECRFTFFTTNEMIIEFIGVLNMNENIKSNDVLTLPISVELEQGDIDNLISYQGI